MLGCLCGKLLTLWDALGNPCSLQQQKDRQSLPYCSECFPPSLPSAQPQTQTVGFAEAKWANATAPPCFQMFYWERLLCPGFWGRSGRLILLPTGWSHSYCISLHLGQGWGCGVSQFPRPLQLCPSLILPVGERGTVPLVFYRWALSFDTGGFWAAS